MKILSEKDEKSEEEKERELAAFAVAVVVADDVGVYSAKQ